MSGNRRVIAVGGAGGIGMGVCQRLAREGYRVVVADLDMARASEVASGLSGSGHEAVKLDITSDADVERVFDQIEQGGPAAALVVIAGATFVDPENVPTVAQMTTAEWDKTVQLNITGPFFCVRKFAAQRLANPLENMRIVTFSSGSGQLGGTPTGIAYVSAKAGLIGFTRQAAFELARDGITVNTIAPGPVSTPEFRRTTSEAARQALAERTPVGRLADPEEIACAVSYLISAEASYVTGTTLDVNGGIHMH